MDSWLTLESKPVLDVQYAPQLQPKDKEIPDRDDSSSSVSEQIQKKREGVVGAVSHELPDAN